MHFYGTDGARANVIEQPPTACLQPGHPHLGLCERQASFFRSHVAPVAIVRVLASGLKALSWLYDRARGLWDLQDGGCLGILQLDLPPQPMATVELALEEHRTTLGDSGCWLLMLQFRCTRQGSPAQGSTIAVQPLCGTEPLNCCFCFGSAKSRLPRAAARGASSNAV